MRGFPGAIDAIGTTEQLAPPARRLLPDEWLAASATGHAPRSAPQRVLDQFDAGADGVILHGATPHELAPVVEAYRELRPAAARRPGSPQQPGMDGVTAVTPVVEDPIDAPGWLDAALLRRDAVDDGHLREGRHRPDRRLLPAAL